MKIKRIKPSKLLSPGEFDVYSDDILRVYFDICKNGGSKYLSPIISTKVGNTDFISNWVWNSSKGLKTLKEKYEGYISRGKDVFFSEQVLLSLENRTKDIVAFLSKLNSDSYMLLDGNHRGLACTLANVSIPAIELETDEDIEQIHKMAKSGSIGQFYRDEKNLQELKLSWVANCVKGNANGEYAGPGVSEGQYGSFIQLNYYQDFETRAKELIEGGHISDAILRRLNI
ncbi:MAG: hypothetical protein ACP5OG_04055 [Candidatus Nanoarchaeia archaeon]